MTKSVLLLGFLAFAQLTVFSAELSDDTLRARILGKWKIEGGSQTVKIDGVLTFNSDETYRTDVTIVKLGDTNKVWTSGKWSIQDGILVEKVERSSDTNVIKVGSVSRDRITSITDRELVYQTEAGKTVKRSRVP